MMALRPYQREAKEAVLKEWDEGRRKTLLTLPTGTGKTVVFANVVKERTDAGGKALILAHRAELLNQAADKLKASCGLEAAFEKAEQSCLGSEAPVAVGSIQSLAQPKRLALFPKDYFTDIVIDEAHHSLSETYQRVLEHFSGANLLGVTATPDRGDMRDLGEYYDSLAYDYSLAQAIRDGYLVPIKAQMIPLQLDLSEVGLQNGDYAAGQLGTALDPYLEKIADEMKAYCAGRKTIVFLPLIRTSQRFCEILNQRGFHAAEVNGKSSDREEILKQFRDGNFDVLCNSMLLTEGFDEPSIDCVINLRPTKVRSLYSQIIGRGTRLCEGKKDLLILDFLWMTGKHDLCKPSSLLCRNEATAKRMDRELAADGEAHDIIELEEQAKRDIVQERETKLARQLAEMRQRQKKLVDPLQFTYSIAAADLADYTPTFSWEKAPPTKRQIEALEKYGIATGAIENCGMASLILDKLIRRRNAGLTTPKQIRLLEKYGFQHVGTWSFDDASKMIERLANNYWQLPYGFQASAYVPEGGFHT